MLHKLEIDRQDTGCHCYLEEQEYFEKGTQKSFKQ